MIIGIKCIVCHGQMCASRLACLTSLSSLSNNILWIVQDMKLHTMLFSSFSGCFLDLRHETPRKSPETTFFPYDNDAICTLSQNICRCYSFTYFIIFILEVDTPGNKRAECDSWYQLTCVLISITCGTEHFNSGILKAGCDVRCTVDSKQL
jgi:hypothetical protein